ncbi:MAG: glycosyltransferase family 4 protein [Cyanobacteria bacterium P01_A01_bin.84]
MLTGKTDKNLNSNSLKAEDEQNLFIFLEIFEREGGIQSYVKDIFRAYKELDRQYRADVFLLRDSSIQNNPFESENLKFHYFKSQSPHLGRMKITVALVRYILQKRPKKVFCGHINLAVLIQSICQPLGIPYVVLTYGKEVWKPLPKKYQSALANASQIWTISRYSRDQACAANYLDPNKVYMLPCAIDGDKFTPGIKSSELISKYGLQDKKVLMTVARLWSGDIYKGVDVTIRALPKVTAVFPNIKYLVIGRGDDQPRLAQLAQDLGVAEQVVFAGFVPTQELINHYRLADAYVMPSQEGFGIVYLEAMACGIPVISGDDDGSADPVQDGEVGWRVPHRDSEAVASACIEILTGEDRRCDGKWLREKAIAKFGMDALSKSLQKYIVV